METYFPDSIRCALYAMSDIHDLCDAHVDVLFEFIATDYLLGCWYLLYSAQAILNQDSPHLMLRGMCTYFFFPPFISYGPLYNQVINFNLVYFVTFMYFSL